MEATVQKWGNSLALRIPSAMAKDVHLRRGSLVELAVVKGTVVVTPKGERNYSLAGMLKAVNKENVHSEQEWGRASGKEAL